MLRPKSPQNSRHLRHKMVLVWALYSVDWAYHCEVLWRTIDSSANVKIRVNIPLIVSSLKWSCTATSILFLHYQSILGHESRRRGAAGSGQPGRLTPQYCARWVRPTCLIPQYFGWLSNLDGAFCSISTNNYQCEKNFVVSSHIGLHFAIIHVISFTPILAESQPKIV